MKRREDGKWGDGGRGFHPISFWHIIAFAGAVFLALVVSNAYRSIDESLGFSSPISPLNDNCELLSSANGPVNSEDFAEYEKGLFFVSAGDLGPTFGKFKRAVKDGKMWMFDANTDSSDKFEKRLKPVKIEGLPPRSRLAFQPHGIHYSKRTKTLYAISHSPDKGGEKVFTFTASPVKGGKGVDSVKLKFERALSTEATSALFGGFNDVVEGTKKGEFYMTQLFAFPLPKTLGNPQDAQEHLHQAGNYLSLFTPGLTGVVRCTYDPKKKSEKNEDVVCSRAVSGLNMANGISTNDDRDTYWVADGRRLYEFKRLGDGTFEQVDKVLIPHMIDNIEWNAHDENLYLGAAPNALEIVADLGKGTSHPGALHVVKRDFGKIIGSEDVVVHSGEKLGSVSAGNVYKGKAFVGSPFHPGMLVCELPK